MLPQWRFRQSRHLPFAGLRLADDRELCVPHYSRASAFPCLSPANLATRQPPGAFENCTLFTPCSTPLPEFNTPWPSSAPLATSLCAYRPPLTGAAPTGQRLHTTSTHPSRTAELQSACIAPWHTSYVRPENSPASPPRAVRRQLNPHPSSRPRCTMADSGIELKTAGSRLRERPSAKPLHLRNSDDAKQKVLELNEEEEKEHTDDSGRRTYGRTPDGTGTFPRAAA